MSIRKGNSHMNYPLRTVINEQNSSPGFLRIIFSLSLILSTSSFANAQNRSPRGGPPAEAFTACEQSAQKDVCTIETDRGVLTGTCSPDRRKEDVLLCVPDNRDHQRSEGPPESPEEENK